jgi:hypothetical protein
MKGNGIGNGEVSNPIYKEFNPIVGFLNIYG